MSKKPKRRKSVRKRPRVRRKKAVRRKKTNVAYQADPSFELFKELRALIIKAAPAFFPQLERRLKRLGRVKLAVVTGVFLSIGDARVDLLLVGDDINLRRLTSFIRELEAELGKEIRYVTLSVPEFKYRYEMYDRFLRDIFDLPHERVIEKLKM